MNYLKQNCRAPLIAWLKGFPFTVTFNKPGRGSDTFLGLPSIAFFLNPIKALFPNESESYQSWRERGITTSDFEKIEFRHQLREW